MKGVHEGRKDLDTRVLGILNQKTLLQIVRPDDARIHAKFVDQQILARVRAVQEPVAPATIETSNVVGMAVRQKIDASSSMKPVDPDICARRSRHIHQPQWRPSNPRMHRLDPKWLKFQAYINLYIYI